MQSVAAAAFWIGLVCAPLSDAQRADLELDPGQGVVVSRVAEDGPAAKAGLKSGDVILTVDYMPLADCQQLGRSVQAAGLEEASLALTVLRDGEAMELNVTPLLRKSESAGAAPAEALPTPRPRIRRPRAESDSEQPRVLSAGEFRSLLQRRKALKEQQERINQQADEVEAEVQEQFQLQESANDPSSQSDTVRMVIPGEEIIFGLLNPGELPDGVTVTISRTGKEPTKVMVSRGEEVWETTTDKLDVIPEDLRPYVVGMLGPRAAVELMPQILGNARSGEDVQGAVSQFREEIQRQLRSRSAGAEQAFESGAEKTEREVERRLDDVSRQVEDIRQQLQGLIPALRGEVRGRLFAPPRQPSGESQPAQPEAETDGDAATESKTSEPAVTGPELNVDT